MTIKEQGGIFGRNPTFNDVEVDGSLSLGDSKKATFGASGDLEIFHSGSTSFIKDVGTGDLQIFGGDDVFIRGSSTNNYMARFREEGSVDLYHDNIMKFQTVSSGISVEGNVKVTDGNGIDFSATSGTGTSELFNDYEEGDFSPAFVASGVTITHDVQLGRYVKIGDMVTVWINLGTDAVSGTAANLTISGLPYTTESGYSGGIAIGLNYSFSSPVQQLRFATSGTTIDIYQNNSATRQTSAILGTGANSNRLQFSGSYRVA